MRAEETGAIKDTPKHRSALVTVALLPEGESMVAVKIIGVLGEEVLVT